MSDREQYPPGPVNDSFWLRMGMAWFCLEVLGAVVFIVFCLAKFFGK